jgi:DNA-binding LacI/PurR family transcriptional regulator
MNGPGLSSVGVFVSHYHSDFLNEFLEEFAAACAFENLRMQVYRTHQDERVAEMLRRLTTLPSEEGVIILGVPQRTARDLSLALSIKKYRCVTADTLIPGSDGSYVGTDNALGIRLGMKHLMELGHRRILYLVNEPEEAETVRIRAREFHAVVAEYQLEGSHIFYCGTQFWEDSPEIVYRRMPELCYSGAPYTALFATSDAGALAALRWLSDNGISVPEQMSVMGFGDDAPSRLAQPPLSTIQQQIPEMALKAVAILLSETDAQVFVPPALIVRQSTGPAPGR